MNKIVGKVIRTVGYFIGFSVLLYPSVSNYLNQIHGTSVVSDYQQQVSHATEEEENRMFAEAQAYNQRLLGSISLEDPFEAGIKQENTEYESLLNMGGNGVMGYVEIPKIKVLLPIYHGTDAEILERGAGHLAASSIPVGGKNTHSVLTGHTGLSSAKLFTDLTEMKKEDLFFIHVLDRTLAYKVDQISVVKPEDTRKLQIVKGKDYVTLVTCTPYGVNDHRLLVRGVRTKYVKKQRSSIRPRNQDSQWMGTYKRAIAIGLAIVMALALSGKVYQKLRRKKAEKIRQKEGETK